MSEKDLKTAANKNPELWSIIQDRGVIPSWLAGLLINLIILNLMLIEKRNIKKVVIRTAKKCHNCETMEDIIKLSINNLYSIILIENKLHHYLKLLKCQ